MDAVIGLVFLFDLSCYNYVTPESESDHQGCFSHCGELFKTCIAAKELPYFFRCQRRLA